MQGLLTRAHLKADEIDVRPATQADRSAIHQLTEGSRRVHFNLDWWTYDDWLYPDRSSDAVWLAMHHDRAVGLLLVPTDESPVAWLRTIATADGYDAASIFTVLVERTRPALRGLGVNTITALAHPNWLADLLPAAGFTRLTEVMTLRKDDRSIPTAPSARHPPALIIRPAKLEDVPIIAANDRAAFDPAWWHSASSIEHILRIVAHFIVAEVEGQVVGHAFSDLYGGQGHLIRLAVHPHFRQRGIGERLLIESLDYQIKVGGQPLTVNTQIDNLPSLALYRRFGYRSVGRPVQVMQRVISDE